MTRMTPRRFMILHFGQRRFTDGDTFMILTPSQNQGEHFPHFLYRTMPRASSQARYTQQVIIPHFLTQEALVVTHEKLGF